MEKDKELTESLNDMIDSKNIDDMKFAAGIIQAQPNLVAKDILHWYNINDYITPKTIKYVELYSKEGGSDKVYILILNQTSKFYYEVEAYYGRRGKSLRYDNKYQGIDETVANRTFNRYSNEKQEKKGYQLINKKIL